MILVTGATGLLGSHLLVQLASTNEKIIALTRNKNNIHRVRRVFGYYSKLELFERIHWEEADVLDYNRLLELFNNIEKVYHCAGEVAFTSKNKQKTLTTNINGTANVVNACLERKVKKLCHVSSVAAIGSSDDNKPATEQDIWASNHSASVYSKSKFYAEMEVWRGIEEGLNAVIVNPSIIIGPGNWDSGTGALFKLIAKGIPFYPTGSMGFVDVRDVARSMILLMDSSVQAERFIINSENLSYREVFSLIATSVGKRPPMHKLSFGIAYTTALANEILSYILPIPEVITREMITSAFSHKTYCNDKIKNAIGISFMPIEQSIRDTAKLYLLDKAK